MITSLSKWLHNKPATFSNFPPLYNSLISRQTRIGWKQLFLGRFVFKWSDLQQDYLVLQNITSNKYSGTPWVAGVTQIIWHHVYSNWEARNADLHGIDANMIEQAQYAQAQREPEEIYSQQSLVKPCDQEVFYSNTHEHFHKESTAQGLKQWLNTWILHSIIPSATSSILLPLLDVVQLHLIAVLAPFLGGRAHLSTACRLRRQRRGSV